MRRYRFILLVLLLLASAGCERFFFYPSKEIFIYQGTDKVDAQDVFFKASDGALLHGWFLTPVNTVLSGAARCSGTIIFFHGNAGNMAKHLSSVSWLLDEGCAVFIFDYRGYGRSEGRPDIKGVHLDAEAALDYVFSLPPDRRRRVFVYGQSLGGAIAITTVAHSAHKKDIKAVIAEGAFSGYRAIARDKLGAVIIFWPFKYPVPWLFIGDGLSPLKWIKALSPTPVLIVHGQKDGIVPPQHGKTLYNEASEPKELWDLKDARHINAFMEKETQDRLIRYMDGIK